MATPLMTSIGMTSNALILMRDHLVRCHLRVGAVVKTIAAGVGVETLSYY